MENPEVIYRGIAMFVIPFSIIHYMPQKEYYRATCCILFAIAIWFYPTSYAVPAIIASFIFATAFFFGTPQGPFEPKKLIINWKQSKGKKYGF